MFINASRTKYCGESVKIMMKGPTTRVFSRPHSFTPHRLDMLVKCSVTFIK